MGPKKVTDKAITAELSSVVEQIYKGPDRDKLSVNYARELVEEKLGLDEGFLKEDKWKAKSKEIIRSALEAIENAESEPEPSPQAPKRKAKQQPKNGARAKRAKKSPSPTPELAEPSEPSDDDEASDVSEQPIKKRNIVKPSKKRRVVSDEDDEVSDGSAKEPEPAKKNQKKKEEATANVDTAVLAKDDSSELSELKSVPESADKIPDSDDESELSEVNDEPPKRGPKAQAKPKTVEKPKPVVVAKDDGNESSSSLSSVIDDGPPTKRKGKGSAPDKTTAGRKPKAAAAETSPDEALIKQLQGQLLKCGVRKVWAFEFKKGGQTTPKAKINRLKEMLAEIGMTGRFSEVRAKEIKTQRELMADLDAVKEWDQTFGVADGGRRSRRGAPVKSFKEPSISGDDAEGKDDNNGDDESEESEEESDVAESSESSEEDGASEDSEEEEKPKKAKGKGAAKRRADVISDEESDSD
ncbi:hypothetical protein QBC40DRAFT_336732 [Triangularia verruculosa]|uniref:Transcriptional regulator n=1 Tax=Triangularia verruculosa TaxID=2587418 RepID=A0AAN6XQ27_9PEZI|nr:hypothetical protein QBC40DRAFT_336732 [Triangularia verruculosa]